MKKNYLLLVLLVFCGTTVWGQSFKKHDLGSLNKGVVVPQSEDLNVAIPVEMKKADFAHQAAALGDLKKYSFLRVRQAPVAALETEYRRPEGSLVRNAIFNKNGSLSQYTIPILVVPARRDILFWPWASDQNAQFSWSTTNATTGVVTDLSDITDAEGNLNYFFNTTTPSGYTGFIPELKATVGNQSATYKYGQEITAGASFNASPNNFGEYTLTNCDVHLGGGPYDSFETGVAFGSSYSKDGVPCTGVLALHDAPLGILSFKSIDVLATTKEEDGVMIPEGKTLSLSIHYLTESGAIEEEPVATSVATPANVTQVNWASFINFKFQELDEDGFITESTIHLQGKPYVVIVEGFDSTYDIQVLFGGAHGWAGDGYTLHGNKLETFGYQNQPKMPSCNLLIAFDGVFNCFEIEEATNNLTVPNAGGAAVDVDQQIGTIVYSTFAIDDIELVEKDDWLTVTYDSTDFAKFNVLYFAIEGTALPEDMTGRVGKVVLGSFDRTITIWVKQGDANVGLPSTKTELTQVARQGDNFELTYPVSATAVSVYNLTGQRIADYKLNANGTTTIPAANWARGVYVLKFNGSNSTVKVIK